MKIENVNRAVYSSRCCVCYSISISSFFFPAPDLAPDTAIVNAPILACKVYNLSQTVPFRMKFPLKVTALGGGHGSALPVLGLDTPDPEA